MGIILQSYARISLHHVKIDKEKSRRHLMVRFSLSLSDFQTNSPNQLTMLQICEFTSIMGQFLKFVQSLKVKNKNDLRKVDREVNLLSKYVISCTGWQSMN